MATALRFADVVEAVDQLSVEEQETLIALVRRRLAARGRERILEDVREGEREFAEGLCQPMTAEEIMREALS